MKKYFGNEKIDLIISHSLPPELAWIAGGLKKHFKCPFFLIQSDYTWQDAVAFGYFGKNNPACLYYRFWENLIMKQVDYIGCPTKGNISFIKTYYPKIDSNKLKLLPFWQKEIRLKSGNLKGKYGLNNKFVVIYGGSIGAAQRIEHLIELADACKEYKDIVFLILGKGAYLGVINQMVKDRYLTSVVFMDFMPQDEYLQFLASCDVGMIILNEKMATPHFPSKSLAYLNMRVPILAALDHTTDFGIYLEENGAGLWAYSDDIPTLKQKLMQYYHNADFRETTKEKGYNLYINNMTPAHAYNTIMKDLKI